MKIILGIVLGVLLTGVTADFSAYLNDNYPNNKTVWEFRKLFIDPQLGINDVVSGRCTEYDRGNGVTNRQYFQCNKVQILFSDLIWGEEKLK